MNFKIIIKNKKKENSKSEIKYTNGVKFKQFKNNYQVPHNIYL